MYKLYVLSICICINCLLCTQTITFAMAVKVVAALILLLVSAEAGEHRRWCGVWSEVCGEVRSGVACYLLKMYVAHSGVQLSCSEVR